MRAVANICLALTCISFDPMKFGSIITAILQRLRKINQLAQGHAAGEGQGPAHYRII